MSAAGVTLVLSGGGAKTAAHVGAARAIEEAGLVPLRYVATSMGAVVAAALAGGADLALWRADAARPPLVYVRPRVERSATFRLDRVRQYAEDGYRATRDALSAAGRP